MLTDFSARLWTFWVQTRYSYDGINRRIKKESETSLDMSASSPVWGCYIIDALEQQVAAGIGSLYATTTQNFVYHPLSKYDHILMTYGRNMATQKFVYGEADKASLIKIDRYDQMGDRWDEQSDDTYYDCYYDYANSYLAKETFQDDYCPTTRYVIKDIRGSVEQLVSRWGYKAESYQYTAFGEERYQMSIDDIYVVPERNRVTSVAL